MTAGDFLWCAVNLLLDQEETLNRLCPACRARAEEPLCPVCGVPHSQVSRGDNPGFDLQRFQQLQKGEPG